MPYIDYIPWKEMSLMRRIFTWFTGGDGAEKCGVHAEEEGVWGTGEDEEEGRGEEEVWWENGRVWAREDSRAREAEEDWRGKDPGEAETQGGKVRGQMSKFED